MFCRYKSFTFSRVTSILGMSKQKPRNFEELKSELHVKFQPS